MKLLLKAKTVKTAGLIAILPILLIATLATHYMAAPAKTNTDSIAPQSQSANAADKKQSSNGIESNVSTQESQPNNQQTMSSNTVTAATPKSSTINSPTSSSPQASTSTSYRQPTASSVPTCNESMKTSYANAYNSQVTAENTSWGNQVNSWNNYASGHGMSFSGYTQSMINQYKPAHDAKLAQLQAQYQQNLASIKCSS